MVKSSRLLSVINRRKIIKNLGQFASIIIITLLAVCLAVGLNSSAQTLESKLDYLLEESNYADGIVFGLTDVISDEEINLIKNDVEEYQKRLDLKGVSNNIDMSLLITDGVATINKPFTNELTNGVYITEKFAAHRGYKIGDVVSISVDMSNFTSQFSSYASLLDRSVKDGKTNILKQSKIDFNFKISGFMYHPEGISDSEPIVMTYDDFSNTLFDIIKDNYIDSSTNPFILTNSQIIDFIKSQGEMFTTILFKGDFNYIKDKELFPSNKYILFDTEYNAELLQLRNDITQAYKLTYVFPVIFILVSILIIITTISQLIFKEKLNIATLKSIGISNGQIYSHYMLLTISLCLIGGITGSIIGPMLIPNVMGIKYDLLYSLPHVNNVYDIFPIFSNIFLFIIISTIVSYLILRSSVNTLPAVLIKNKGNHKFKTSKFKIKSWSLKIALRNISQNVYRSLMVIIGVGGCGALFITGFGIDDTLNNTINTEITRNFPSDITITFSDYLDDSIKDLDGVNIYEEYSVVQGSINAEGLTLTSMYIIEDDTQIFNKGNFDGVYISSKIAKNLNVEIDDYINITIKGVSYNLKIDNIIEIGFFQGLFIPKSLVEEQVVTNAWVTIDSNSNVSNEIKSLEFVKTAVTTEEFLEYCDEVLGPISIIKITLQVFAVLLGIVVLYNLALLNYKERHRDIATLKVLGLTNIEIAKSLLYEMMILSICGALFGLAIGYPILVLLLSINEVDFFTYIYKLEPLSYLTTFLFITFTALCINLVLFKQINKIKMVESLKSVE